MVVLYSRKLTVLHTRYKVMEKELINIIESSKEFCTILLSLELKYVLKIKLYMYKFQYQNSVIVEINTRVIKTSV